MPAGICNKTVKRGAEVVSHRCWTKPTARTPRAVDPTPPQNSREKKKRSAKVTAEVTYSERRFPVKLAERHCLHPESDQRHLEHPKPLDAAAGLFLTMSAVSGFRLFGGARAASISDVTSAMLFLDFWSLAVALVGNLSLSPMFSGVGKAAGRCTVSALSSKGGGGSGGGLTGSAVKALHADNDRARAGRRP